MSLKGVPGRSILHLEGLGLVVPPWIDTARLARLYKSQPLARQRRAS